MAKSKNTNLNAGSQGQKGGKLGRPSTGKIDQLQKPITDGNGFPKQDKQFSTLGKPTNFEAGKADGSINRGKDLTSNTDGLPRQDRQFSTLGKPTNFEATKTDIRYNGGVGLTSEVDGFPRQDRGFSTLGKLNKQGTYTNTKFNQAVAGKGEDISAQFIGNQQLSYNKGSGPGTVEVPQALNVPTFYILAETGDIINGYGCSSGLPCSSGCEDIQDRLMWPI